MKKNKLYIFILIACFIGYCWLFFSSLYQHEIDTNEATVCLFKKITNVPCPSCGTTRAVMYIFKGEITTAVFINPFGVIVALLLLTTPVWILFDFLTKKSSFYQFYKSAEKIISTKWIAIILIVLVLINWIWNINKGL